MTPATKHVRVVVARTRCVVLIASALATVVTPSAWAQSTTPQQTIPAGVARTAGEAPGGALAPMPADVPATGTSQTMDPATSRSATFAASRGECRETVPGGNLLAIAYAIVLGFLGIYVALLARKNAQLFRAIEGLERDLARKRDEHGGAPKSGADDRDPAA